MEEPSSSLQTDQNLGADFHDLLTSEQYSDCVLVAGEAHFKAHRAVLVARCKRLKEVLEAVDGAATDGGLQVNSRGKKQDVSVLTTNMLQVIPLKDLSGVLQ